MLADAPHNKNKPKDKWSPPPGYKSALGKARDAARDAEKKKNSATQALTGVPDAEVTANEGDGEFSQVGGRFSMCALRPPTIKTAQRQTSTLNRFDGLTEADQEYDDQLIQDLNSFAHRVYATTPNLKKLIKSGAKHKPDAHEDKEEYPRLKPSMPAPGAGCEIPSRDKFIVIKNSKDLEKLDPGIAAALPTNRKALAKISKKLEDADLVCGPGECLAMVDTGSYTHAIDARKHLPAHSILEIPKSEVHRVAETACGGTLSMLGKVKTSGSVGGVRVSMTWSHMEVKCPILSVRCLVEDGHDVWIRKGGGIIRNITNNKEIKFYEHAGVYYLKMKVDDPDGGNSSSLFTRPGA